MSIIIQQTIGEQFRPSGNKAYSKWTSSLSNILYYEVEVLIATNFTNPPSLSIGTFIAEPFPEGDFKTAVFEAGRVIEPYVKDVFKYNNLDNNPGYQRHLENVLAYRLKIKEVYMNNGVKTKAPIVQTINSYFYKGKLDEISMSTYDTGRMFLNVSNLNIPSTPLVHWMNKYPKQQYKTTRVDEKEWLYILNSYLGQQLEIKVLYNNKTQSKTIYNTINEPGQGLNWRPTRFDVSPSFIFTPTELLGLKNYEIEVWKKSNPKRQLSESFKYTIKPTNCNNRKVQFFFQNSFGVYEPIKLNNPATQVLIEREVMKLNNYQNDRFGLFTNSNDVSNPRESYIFNEIDKTIGTKNIQEVLFYTSPLSDNDMVYLQELLMSNKIYMEIGQGKYVPVIPSTDSYDITPYRYRGDKGGNRVKEISFKLPDNFDVNYIDFGTTYNPAIENYVTGFLGVFI